jgi:hypothetical protein
MATHGQLDEFDKYDKGINTEEQFEKLRKDL